MLGQSTKSTLGHLHMKANALSMLNGCWGSAQLAIVSGFEDAAALNGAAFHMTMDIRVLSTLILLLQFDSCRVM